MSEHAFELVPFPGGPALPYRIGGRVDRQGSRLTLVYALTGAVAGVAWPPVATAPERRDLLWEATCAECFLTQPADEGYWEANFSPAGHWQLYRLDGYREGMHPEAAVTTVAIATEEAANRRRLLATLDLGSLIGPEEALQIGITMVVRTSAGTASYWALRHPGEQPDFHHRAGFCLAL